MSDNFNPEALAGTIYQQLDELTKLQKELDKDPATDAAKYAQLEHNVAEKIRTELNPLWCDPSADKLQQIGTAMQALGVRVTVSNIDKEPVDFTLGHQSGDRFVGVYLTIMTSNR